MSDAAPTKKYRILQGIFSLLMLFACISLANFGWLGALIGMALISVQWGLLVFVGQHTAQAEPLPRTVLTDASQQDFFAVCATFINGFIAPLAATY